MQSINLKIYSKKSCQKLILKCVMKLLLKNDENFKSNKCFKLHIKQLLINNGYKNESIFKHLSSLNNSQMSSCINLAKKNIERYNYKKEYEIVIDEIDFKISKSIKRETLNLSKDVVTNVISILEDFRIDNLMIRF